MSYHVQVWRYGQVRQVRHGDRPQELAHSRRICHCVMECLGKTPGRCKSATEGIPQLGCLAWGIIGKSPWKCLENWSKQSKHKKSLENTWKHSKSWEITFIHHLTWNLPGRSFIPSLHVWFISPVLHFAQIAPKRSWPSDPSAASKSLAADDACRKPSSATLASLSALSNVCRWKSWRDTVGDEAENEWDIASRWDTCTVYITTSFIFIYIYLYLYLYDLLFTCLSIHLCIYLLIYLMIYLFLSIY